MDRQDAGRFGGLTTSLRYSHDHYVEIGRKGGLLGGRPRRRSITELQEMTEAEIVKTKRR